MKAVRYLPVFVLLAVLALPLAFSGGNPVMAQDGGVLEYGQEVTGELSDDAFEIVYTFKGAEGDVIVVEMGRANEDSNVDEPALQLIGPDGGQLAARDSFGSVAVAAVLPASGEYTLIATRTDGGDGESVGAYTLRLLLLEELGNGDSVSSTVTNNVIDYYFIRGGAPITLTYFREAGDYAPSITLNTINADPDSFVGQGTLEAVATLEGEELEAGMVRIAGDADVYIVRLDRALFDFFFNEVTADYTLEVEISE